MDPSPGAATTRFVLDLGRALHQAGAPAHRLEEAMGSVCSRLGVEGRFFSTPTAIFAGFGPPEAARTAIVRVAPADVDLERLSDLDALAEQVVAGELSPGAGAVRIQEISSRPPRFGAAAEVIAFGIAACTATRLFGGGAREIAASGGAGMLIGALAVAARRLPGLARVLPTIAAVVAALLAEVLFGASGPAPVLLVTLGGLIVLLPGLTATVAMTELATGHLVSGSARLAGALTLFVQVGLGAAVGGRAGAHLHLLPDLGAVTPLPPLTEIAAVAAAPFGLLVLFRARPSDIAVLLPASGIAFASARAGASILGPELGVLGGALLLGVVANLFARLRRRPAALPILGGIMVLVPGGVGFRSVSSLLRRDVVAGVGTAFSMVLVAAALAGGLLLASLVVSPRRAL